MSQKNDITKLILETLGLDSTKEKVKKTIPLWWFSTRQKEKGGLRLSAHGFQAFQRAGIKEYRIRFGEPIFLNNQLLVWIDNFIDCPFYLTDYEIYVFSEKMAVQLILFSGNIYKYSFAKAKKQST